MIPRIALGSAIAILLASTSGPLSAQSGPAPRKLSIGFDSEGAVVEGITPGGNVAWLGASRSREEWGEHLAHWRLLTADDETGPAATGLAADAVAALVAMGVQQREALDRVERCLADEPGLTLEDLVKAALR